MEPKKNTVIDINDKLQVQIGFPSIPFQKTQLKLICPIFKGKLINDDKDSKEPKNNIPTLIISFIYKTQNDMSGFSESSLQEREKITETFITQCQKLHNLLKKEEKSTFHFDFIDPSSGKAFLNPGNSQFLETEDSVNFLSGISVIDLGCCKALDHCSFSTFCMCCSIFTDYDKKIIEDSILFLKE